MSLSLAQRDIYILKIQEEIENKRRLLIKKKKELSNKNNENEYLIEVRAEYSKYYDYIIKEKEEQYKALILLQQYVNDLIETEEMVDSQLHNAKDDQKKIIKEISKIKRELNELMEE